MKTKIPYARHWVTDSDVKAVTRVLRSDWLTQGPMVSQFEKEIAAYCGSKFAVAVANGTAALHLACLAASLRPGDQAITTPITFAATANAVLYTGATPVFSDIDEKTGNLDPDQVVKKINSKTRAILPVHFAGLPADMRAFRAIAQPKKIIIIEDAAHALGATYRGTRIGSCRYSDMTVFSFHPVKPITTGEGGCITTNSPKLYKSLKALSSHGIYREPALSEKVGGWYYEMRALGFNYRITDLQCALGLSQLKKIHSFLNRRQEIAERYQKAFSDDYPKLRVPETAYADRSHAWHLYPVRLQTKVLRRRLYEYLKASGILCQVHYIPVYQHPYYRKRMPSVSCPKAEVFYDQVLSLPLFPSLSNKKVDSIIACVKKGLV